MNHVTAWINVAKEKSELLLALFLVSIMAGLIVPLPAFVLDAAIGVNLVLSALVLLAALQATDTLRLATFPTLLLLTTLFRLALSVSSTRLALSEGHAGQVIAAFGEFVVRGDFVVGFVIFAILTLVQLLVVAKGAERVAEVSARFTLDAMPGKQMAIDAELRAGALTQEQASARRADLERESQLFGAMDGAMKFVKGDVLAGLVIVLVNLLGGTLVGVYGHELSFVDAASTYALIAIGDGLVSQVPSLCVTVAAGFLVTKVGGSGALGRRIGVELIGEPRALFLVAGLSAVLAVMPGMPRLTFAGLAIALAAIAGAKLRAKRVVVATASPERPVESLPSKQTAHAGALPVALLLGQAEQSFATENRQALLNALAKVRELVQVRTGVLVPSVQVVGGGDREGYWLTIDELPLANSRVSLGQSYVRVSVEGLASLKVQGSPVANPLDDRPLAMIPASAVTEVRAAGYESLTGLELLVEHVAVVLSRHTATFVGVQEAQELLEQLEPSAPVLVKQALSKIPLPLLADVLRRLLEEQVSIRPLRTILEALVAPTAEGDATALAETCRRALRRHLSHRHAPSGTLFAYLVEPALEEALRQGANGVAISPEVAARVLGNIGRLARGGESVLLTAPDVRRRLRKLIEGAFPQIAVLTYAELNPALEIRPLGSLAP